MSPLSDALIGRLARAAKKARKNSYCPYSGYSVGAAVLAGSGKIYTGTNVESVSYGLSLCAERTAVFSAIAHGERKLKAVCVAARCASPCGACRQVMLEFSSKDTELILIDIKNGKKDSVRRTSVFKMLPDAFHPPNLSRA